MTTSPFNAQELTYLAHGARALAHLASEDAMRQDNLSVLVHELFANEDRIYRGLAAT
jgi:hypothetical protein